MTMTANESRPFTSLHMLQQASDQLIEGLPDDDELASNLHTEECGERITHFINQAIATGTVLDTQTDRRAAQALVDFWVAKSYAVLRDSRLRQRRSLKTLTILMPFDAAIVDSAIKQGDDVLASLEAKDEDLARQILLSLVRFPEDRDDCITSRRSRKELLLLGDSKSVNALIERLVQAGILAITDRDEDDGVALGYDALLRRWPWLSKMIDERMSYRRMALNWVEAGRPNSALLDWKATGKFRAFGNLSPLETQFADKSGTIALQRLGMRLVAAVLLFVAAAICWESVLWWSDLRTRRAQNELRNKDTPAYTNVGNIKWLSDHSKKIEAIGVNLDTADKKNFSGIFAGGAVFDRSVLREVIFDGATLSGASFRDTIITNSSFRNASLDNATFDGTSFCEKVNISDADVFGASFRGVTFLPNALPDFSRTAWWQATGWRFEQIELLADKFPENTIIGNPRLKNDLMRTQNSIDNEKDPSRQATFFNQKAWLAANYGIVDKVTVDKVEVDAEASAREALKLLQQIKTDKDAEANVNDTLAYILMQKGGDTVKQQANIKEAVERLKSSVDVKKARDRIFRYAVALHANNNEPEAINNLKISVLYQYYEPSHELYLLRRHISGSFRKEMENILGLSAIPAPTNRCPKP
jgi:Pentapeptide repeats (8 copies)